MSFVIPRLREAGERIFFGKVIKRTVLIFLIGVGLNWFPFVKWSGDSLVFKEWINSDNPTYGIRILGVLQRIAISYFFASVLAYYFKPKSLIYISMSILLAYWFLCTFFGTGDPYSLSGWFGTKIDMQVFGAAHMFKGEGVPFDPEGLMSTFPAIIQVILGYLAGMYIREQGNTNWLWTKLPASSERYFKMLSGLMVTGFIILMVAWIWSLGFPINKKIWTSSFVLHTTALAILTIGGVIWYADIQGVRNGLMKFFDVFGKNALFIYVLSGVFPKTLRLIRIEEEEHFTNPLRWFYKNICANIPGPPELGSLIYSLCLVVLMWTIAYWLDRKKIYIKV
ncbi:acyltransferase family protein [Parapedobacter sp. SGR-10]|uniref:acyltransferase family protein n=1 Tax=Parapedobacter sp. SGR-10 TaxID=2710879 RepID=UPI001F100E7A|nr:DUF5009 domain-containing protein [Parapedobacter sp. SGR-10]